MAAQTEEKYISKNYGGILHIWEPIFRMNYYYVEARDAQDLKAIIKKRLKQDIHCTEQQTGAFRELDFSGVKVGLIWASKTKPETLAHECLHAAVWAAHERGVVVNAENDEFLAYYMGFLMHQISDHLKAKRKKKR